MDNPFTKSEAEIKTMELQGNNVYISGNIFVRGKVVIQMRNIAYFSSYDMNEFPLNSLYIWLVLGGIAGIASQMGILMLLGLVVAAAGGYKIYEWWKINESRKGKKILNIALNSGKTFQVTFKDEASLNVALRAMMEVLAKPDIGEMVQINPAEGTIMNIAKDEASIINMIGNTFGDKSGNVTITHEGGDIKQIQEDIKDVLSKLEAAGTLTQETKLALDKLQKAVEKNDKPSIKKVIMENIGALINPTIAGVASGTLVEFIKGFI